MAAIIDTLCEAVVIDLNTQTWPAQFKAEFSDQPTFELAENAGWTVTVVPASEAASRHSRATWQFDLAIDIGVMRRPVETFNKRAECRFLVEEIADWFRDNALTRNPEHKAVVVVTDPIWDPVHLKELLQFSSIVQLTFRSWR